MQPHLVELKIALSTYDVSLCSKALANVIIDGGDDWDHHLLLSGVLPEYKLADDTVIDKVTTLLQAIMSVKSMDDIPTDRFNRLLKVILALADVHFRLSAIAMLLEKEAFNDLSVSTQMYCLAVFLENQNRLSKKFILSQSNNSVDLLNILNSTISDDGDVGISHVSRTENISDVIELIIRAGLHRKDFPKGAITSASSEALFGTLIVTSPYGDPKIRNICELASSWQMLQSIWSGVKYANWSFTDADETRYYMPQNIELFLDQEAAGFRQRNYYDIEMAPYSLPVEAFLDSVSKLISSISIPSAGEKWDGQLDFEALKDSVALSPSKTFRNAVVDLRCLSEILNRISLNVGGTIVQHGEWENVFDLLFVLGYAIDGAIENYVSDDPLRQVVIVGRETLDDLAHRITGLDIAVCAEIIESFVFDHRQNALDIWQRPLLPVGGTQLLLCPYLLTSVHPTRLIEDVYLSVSKKKSLDIRSESYEQKIAAIMGQMSNVKVKHALVAKDAEGVIELDLFVYWDGCVILLEGKCVKAVFDIADVERAWKDVDYSLTQLKRRRRRLPSIWASIREQCPNFNLPLACPADDKIFLISVNNTFHFTGMKIDDIVITDDIVLDKYMGDPAILDINLGARNATVEVIGDVRGGSAPTPQGLMRYLSNPLQVQIFRNQTVASFVDIPHFAENNLPIKVPRGFFLGTKSSQAVIIEQYLAEASHQFGAA